MFSFVPSSSPTLIKTSISIRQNPWQKGSDILDIVRKSNKIYIPNLHTKDAIAEYNENPQQQSTTPLTQVSKNVIDLPIDSLAIIPNHNKGLLVKITSPVKSGIIETACIARSLRKCGHVHVSNNCNSCKDSIRDVFDSSNVNKFTAHLKSENIIEPFYTLYRDVTIIGDVDLNGLHPLMIVSTAPVSLKNQYWSLIVNSSLKPKVVVKEDDSAMSIEEVFLPVEGDQISPQSPRALHKKWLSAFF
jgi:hypothetical protein